jgi:hypothetical protein
MVGDLSNDELAGLAYNFNNGYNPSVADISPKKSLDNSLNALLITEIQDLKNVIKNKPETSFNIDNMGNWEKKVKEGARTITTKKVGLN